MRIIESTVATTVVLLCAVPLAGQTLAPPVRGQDLTATASVGAGYDDDVFAQGQSVPVGTISTPIETSGGYGLTDLALTYSAAGRRVNFGAGANSAFRFYRLEEPFTARQYGGSAGISVNLTERLRAAAAGSAQRSSQHIFWIFPALGENPLGQVPVPSLDYSLLSAASRSYDTSAGLTYNLTRRSSLSAEYGYGTARYQDNSFELTRTHWAGRYSYGFTRYASLRLGYGAEEAEYETGRKFRRRTIDAGIDYARPLSFSRRTTLSFGVGSAALDDGVSTFYNVTGHATLTHQLARRWTLRAAYNRDVGFVNGFFEPFLSDAVLVSATGLLSRRVQVTSMAGYSNGSIGFGTPDSPRFETYTGTGRIHVLLTRGLSAFAEYVYYHYRFDASIRLPLDAPRSLNRQAVRGGLNYTVTVF